MDEKLVLDSQGRIVVLRRRVPDSKSRYRALDVKVGTVVIWFCILCISAIVFLSLGSTSERVLRHFRPCSTIEGDSVDRGKISLTEWPSLHQLQGRAPRDSAASFLPTATIADAITSTNVTTTPTGPLKVFQVSPPVQGPGGSIIQSDGSDNSTALSSPSGNTGSCQVTLMVHVFKDSFGAPFVGKLGQLLSTLTWGS